MSDKKKIPAALLVSDLHFSLSPPVARRAEKDWLAAQLRPVVQLVKLQEELSSDRTQIPIICCGDIFDRWNSPPEIVNWVLQHVPHLIAVPGNHDLAYHSYKDICRTSYWTLVRARKLTNLEPGKPVAIGSLRLHGFPHGEKLRPLKERHSLVLEVAVVHHYVWIKGREHPGAREEYRARSLLPNLEGYDVVISGDNHQGFTWKNWYNCGGFQRRKLSEVDYRPAVGVLYEDGSTERRWLDCSEDKFVTPEEAVKLVEEGEDVQAFVEELGKLTDADVDFREAVLRWLNDNKVRAPVAEQVKRALEG